MLMHKNKIKNKGSSMFLGPLDKRGCDQVKTQNDNVFKIF